MIIEVAYAGPEGQWLVPLQLAEGSCVADAVRESGLALRVPAIAAGSCRLGIFGQVVAADTLLSEGDRVEIYRELIADPKEGRRQRAGRERAARKGRG